MLKKLKSLVLDDTVYMAVLLIIVGVGSFGLGKMSVSVTAGVPKTNVGVESLLAPVPPVTLMVGTATATASTSDVLSKPVSIEKQSQNFVASKAGTKYHAPNCPGAKQIKETNKIFFTTETEAEAAGYTRAANCPIR